MFGYVTIYKPELKVKDFYRYKAFYCGLCRELKRRYGRLGQLTLSYDMTFAILLFTSLYESEITREERRCAVHPVKKITTLRSELTAYGADMNLILSYYHFLDDWQDERSALGLTGTHLFHRRVKEIRERYPRQCLAIRKGLKELRECERRQETSPDIPAGCFGRIMEELFVYRKDLFEPGLRKLGFYLGKFIYLMDAYEDLPADRKKGCYNPLAEMSREGDYEERCAQMLTMMMAECTNAFEKLPCVQDSDILRNVLYAGVWNRYNKMQEKNKEKEGKENGE